MTKKILTVLITLTLLITTLAVLPVHGESEIYSNVLRLHVIANSDSEDDQNLKLLVRDAVLAEAQILLCNVYDRAKAEETVMQNIEILRSVAERTVLDNGYDYPVAIELGEEEYPTKNYESCCFPAGEYTSLRVVLGEGNGQNWWCVLYPPLCIPAAQPHQTLSDVLGQEEMKITTASPKYEVRFAFLELFERIKEAFSE